MLTTEERDLLLKQTKNRLNLILHSLNHEGLCNRDHVLLTYLKKRKKLEKKLLKHLQSLKAPCTIKFDVGEADA